MTMNINSCFSMILCVLPKYLLAEAEADLLGRIFETKLLMHFEVVLLQKQFWS